MARAPHSNGRQVRRPPVRPAAAAPDAAADAELAKLLRQAARHFRTFGEKGSELALLGWRRLKLRATDRLFGLVLALAAAAAGATIIVAAALLLVAGIRHGIARATGADWIGELGGGLLALALPFGALLVVRRRMRRTLLDEALHPTRRRNGTVSPSPSAPPAASPTAPPTASPSVAAAEPAP